MPITYRKRPSPEEKPYPRVVAHRGISASCPENTLPAFAAALSLGADEIELDIRLTKDMELVILHDPTVDRTTNRSGAVKELRWSDICDSDAGGWFLPSWQGVRLARFEDILEHFAGKVVMNIHIYDPGENGFTVRKIKDLASQYDISGQIYIAGNRDVMEDAIQYAPEIDRCCLVESRSWNLVDHAIHYRCARLQFNKNFCNEDLVRRAHEAGMICNVYYADTEEEAERFLKMGIDAILTNTVINVLQVAAQYHEREWQS